MQEKPRETRTLNSARRFYLGLANGQGWLVESTEEARSCVEKFAGIMELNTYVPNGYPRLIFIRKGSGKESWGEPICRLDQDIQEGLPRSGWKGSDHAGLRLWSHDEVPDVICEMGRHEGHEQECIRMRLSLYPIYKRAQESGGLAFHAALVEWNGMGIMLAAPTKTGKSTCCRRLSPPWHHLCDDEALIVRNGQRQYLAHPFPTWSDYIRRRSGPTWNVQSCLPLSAIFFMEKAPIDEAAPIGQGQAAAYMSQSAMQVFQRNYANLDHAEARALRRKLFENACELARSIPAFKLRVSLNGRFWEEMEKVLRTNETNKTNETRVDQLRGPQHESNPQCWGWTSCY